MSFSLEVVPVLNDNYAYLIHGPKGRVTLVIDPGEPGPVLEVLKARGWTLTHILNTHHHGDHVGGNWDLQEATGCHIIGGAHDRHRIPGLNQAVEEGEVLQLGALAIHALHVPGHTLGAVAYWLPKESVLFTGDTLFSLGCGRLFEGTAEQMWSSLKRLRQLPPDTRVYCGHEYTLSNARFAQQLSPADKGLEVFVQSALQRRRQGLPTMPSTLADEKKFNPFLRADDIAWMQALGLPEDPVRAFAALRSMKDSF